MDILFTLLPGDLVSELGLFLTFITLIFYLGECFLGYRLMRSWISILGFLFGAIGGFHMTVLLFHKTGYAIAGAIIGGVLLSALSYKVYLVGIFLIAAYSIFQIGITLLPLESVLLFLVSGILGILAGNLAVKNMRPAIILITAFHGGIMASHLLPNFVSLPAETTILTCGLFLGIAGVLIQFLTSKK